MSALMQYHVGTASAEPLLLRLEAVKKAGRGWRAACPVCGGKSQKVVITESEGRVLIWAFCGHKAIEVLEAVGLGWPDIMPPRHWPESPDERRQARRAIREAGWASALTVLSLESKVALIASRQIASWKLLSEQDDARLALAVERIAHAANVLVEARA